MSAGIEGRARRQERGAAAYRTGARAEQLAEAALQRDGWRVMARRLRTPAGELDLIAERGGMVAMIEVKCRPTLADAACCLQPRQQARLTAAAEHALAVNPDWGHGGVRFDLLLVDRAGQVRRIADAFRPGLG